MRIEMTQEQRDWITDHSEKYAILDMAEKFGLSYQAVYNFCERYKLKYKLTRKEPGRTGTHKPRALANVYGQEVIPDPPRKLKRPPAQYSNLQRDELIDKILYDGK